MYNALRQEIIHIGYLQYINLSQRISFILPSRFKYQ
jgi:hypothetical protein